MHDRGGDRLAESDTHREELAPVLGTSSLRSSTPSTGAESPFNSIFFLSSTIVLTFIALL